MKNYHKHNKQKITNSVEKYKGLMNYIQNSKSSFQKTNKRKLEFFSNNVNGIYGYPKKNKFIGRIKKKIIRPGKLKLFISKQIETLQEKIRKIRFPFKRKI